MPVSQQLSQYSAKSSRNSVVESWSWESSRMEWYRQQQNCSRGAQRSQTQAVLRRLR